MHIVPCKFYSPESKSEYLQRFVRASRHNHLPMQSSSDLSDFWHELYTVMITIRYKLINKRNLIHILPQSMQYDLRPIVAQSIDGCSFKAFGVDETNTDGLWKKRWYTYHIWSFNQHHAKNTLRYAGSKLKISQYVQNAEPGGTLQESRSLFIDSF